MTSAWDDPSDEVVVTTEAVASKRRAILRVRREIGAGGWQCYDDVEPLTKPVVLYKKDILLLDPTLSELKELPLNWEAIRETRLSSWVRSKIRAPKKWWQVWRA
jgi:hypothetical protein